MTYSPIIPQPTDLLSSSQGSILANFSQLNTQYGADHDGFNTGSGNGSGMHDQVTFLANQSAPSLTRNSVLGVSGVYCNAVGGVSCLFFQNSTQNIQMTGTTVASGNGYTFLPGGIILKWGTASISSPSSAITFPVAFPNNCFSMQATVDRTGANVCVAVSNVTKTGFIAYGTVGSSGSGVSFTMYYIAIGN
jgi:hypothetical protein